MDSYFLAMKMMVLVNKPVNFIYSVKSFLIFLNHMFFFHYYVILDIYLLILSDLFSNGLFQSSMIASYNPMMPDLACFYRDHSNQEMQAVLASNLGIAQRSQEDILLIQQPITAQFTCQGKVIGHRHHSLEKALEGVGGMEAVLFLVAQV